MTGVDRLLLQQAKNEGPVVHGPLPYHPDIRMSPSQGLAVSLLKLPNGEGWRFRSGAPASIEESVYLGGEQVCAAPSRSC